MKDLLSFLLMALFATPQISNARVGRVQQQQQRPMNALEALAPSTSTYCEKNKDIGDCPIKGDALLEAGKAADFIHSCPQDCAAMTLIDRATWQADETVPTCTSMADIETFKRMDELKLARGKAQCEKDQNRYSELAKTLGSITEPKCIPPMEKPTKLVIHHTTDEGFGGVKGVTPKKIQQSHMGDRGWSDIGYHFLIAMDENGEWQIYEGRKRLEGDCAFNQGGHAGPGLNGSSLGIAIAGNYEKDSKPSWAGPDGSPQYPAGALKRLMQLTANLKKDCPSLNDISGHGNHQGEGYGCVQTQCPGASCQAIIENLKGVLK